MPGWATILVGLVVLGTSVAAPVVAGLAAPEVVRHSGPNRYATAADVSASNFQPGVERVFLATGDDFPDALAAVPIAGPRGYPLLLVRAERIPEATAQELQRLQPGSITILGGANAVSRAVLLEARDYTNGPIRRVSGASRYDTAAELVDTYVGPNPPVVYVATGVSSADSLAGGPAAAADGGPLLLVRPDRVPTSTAETLEVLQPARIVVLGGEGAVSAAVEAELAEYLDPEPETGLEAGVTRLSGANRYDTAAAIVHAAFPGLRSTTWMTTGTTFPDGLAGGVVAARDGQPLVTVRPDCVPAAVLAELERMVLEQVTVLGGTGAVSDAAAGLEPCSPGIGVRTSTIATGLDVPWDLVFTPGERVFLTERDNGRVLELEPDGDRREVVRFPHVDNDHEGGLTGLAVHPDWDPQDASTQWLYALYVHEDPANPEGRDQRVVRFHPDEQQPPDNYPYETVITGLPHDGEVSHFAGRIDFHADPAIPSDVKLWVSIGDVRDAAAAQDPHSLKGKILRYEVDGSVPEDNPIPVDELDPDGPKEPVWAMGFRDPQGMAWDDHGRMFASEFGPNSDDEVNRIVAGGNYGWPCVIGPGKPRNPAVCDHDLDDLVDPIVVRENEVASWSGASILRDASIPEWEGDLFVAALRGQRLYRVDLDDGEVQEVEELLVHQYGRLRHVTPAPDGSLWIITSNQDDNGDPAPGDDRIVRLGLP